MRTTAWRSTDAPSPRNRRGTLTAEGTCEHKDRTSGDGGFGYDPLLARGLPRHVAEVSLADKNKIAIAHAFAHLPALLEKGLA